MSRFSGFAPVSDEESRVLILGSFPSVKSRAEGFYYGNPQNRFWRMLADFFGERVPENVGQKRDFLLRNKVAVWDMVASCEVVGSADVSISKEETVDVKTLLSGTKISLVLCNGAKAYELFARTAAEYLPIARKMPSTSPANPRYSESVWHDALSCIFAQKSVDICSQIR